jgi:hypothetical protein
MSLIITCPFCKNDFSCGDSKIGTSKNCPVCGKAIIIAKTDAGHDTHDHKNCPFCGKDILSVAAKCKHCGEFVNCAYKTVTPEEFINRAFKHILGLKIEKAILFKALKKFIIVIIFLIVIIILIHLAFILLSFLNITL